MKIVGTLLALAYLMLIAALSAQAAPPSQTRPGNVIFVTIDGVRWQEATNHAIFPRLWSAIEREGVMFGGPRGTQATLAPMVVGNPMFISLPAYESIMTGKTQPCFTNNCPQVKVETMQERARRALRLPFDQVASITSWLKIPRAVEHIVGSTFVNGGFAPLVDPAGDDREVDEINARQNADLPPWQSSRFDRYTFAHSMLYLKKHQPRFLYIALNDSDDWAHFNNHPRYLEALGQYDRWLGELLDYLKRSGAYGENTTLIVTTDHGRGKGKEWTSHGLRQPSSRHVWLFAAGPGTRAFHADTGAESGPGWPPAAHTTRYLSHLDIRPTIEAALGLKPQACYRCGHPIVEIARP